MYTNYNKNVSMVIHLDDFTFFISANLDFDFDFGLRGGVGTLCIKLMIVLMNYITSRNPYHRLLHRMSFRFVCVRLDFSH